MKIYTKTGDTGETSLFGGERVSKDDPRIEAYGTIDELNSAIGIAISSLPQGTEDLQTVLEKIQHQLLNIGSELATLKPNKTSTVKLPTMNADTVDRLDAEIDKMSAKLPELRQFILPGGTSAASLLHLARTICRRAERRIVALAKNQSINPELIRYINRLSDLLFTCARTANACSRRADVPWQSDQQ